VRFEYLEHTADVALRGVGKTVEEAFCEAARAMTNLMVDLDRVRPEETVPVERSAERLDLLLVEWLAAFLAEKDLSRRVFSRFRAEVHREEEGYRLEGEGRGEVLDPSRHGVKLEVKGITYAGLRVVQENGEWIAQCVVDV
jgi:SHS2 domain-containing protein